MQCHQFRGERGNGKINREIIDCKTCINWFQKGCVNGRKTREVYSFLKRELPRKKRRGGGDIEWNFAKFLVDHEGRPFKRYQCPGGFRDIRNDIEYLMQKRGPSEMEVRKSKRDQKLLSRSTDIFMG